jgi:hypothetical protein
MTEHTPGGYPRHHKIAVGFGVGPGRIKPWRSRDGGWWAAQTPSSCSSLQFPASLPPSDPVLTGHG